MHFSASREMISVVDKYFSFNRITLLTVGLWPYQKSKLSRIHLFCCFGIVVTFILFQLTTFLTSKCTVDHIIKIFSFLFPLIIIVLNYYWFLISNDTVKYSIERLQRTYDELKDNNEIAIIERYGKYAKYYTIALGVTPLLLTTSQLPYFKNLIFFTNESQSYHLAISTEYFINQEKYFYIILLHVIATIYISITVLTATAAMFIAYLQYVYGMFQIASYRIKNTIKMYTQNINLENRNLVHKGLIHGVNIHRKAMMFSEHLISKFEMLFFFLIILGVITLSLNIFRFLQLSSSNYQTMELLLVFGIICMSILYMFLANLCGQNITDHYNLLFVTAYEVKWYITPLCIQKFILFLLIRGNKQFGLSAGGLFTASLQCFSMLLNASLSYFLAIYSMQQ